MRRGIARGAIRSGSVNVDADWLWFLWAHPLSPLFGKDRMATFETYFIADESTHEEHKNAYFEFIHDAAFCRRVLAEFGVSESEGLISTVTYPSESARRTKSSAAERRTMTALSRGPTVTAVHADFAADRIAFAASSLHHRRVIHTGPTSC